MSQNPTMSRAVQNAPLEAAGFAAIERRVASLVRRKVPASDADDLTQQIVLRILQRVDGLRDQERAHAWVRRVAHNAVVDFYRQRARHPPLVGFEDPPRADTGDPSEQIASQLADCLRPLLESLPPAFAEALTWVEFQGLTQAEAAARAGISLSGMKSRVQRGRRLLKARVLACCAVELDARRRVVDCQPRHDRDSVGADGTTDRSGRGPGAAACCSAASRPS
jgi:RNA polymerase sigma-70 factor (ECF subfamily)